MTYKCFELYTYQVYRYRKALKDNVNLKFRDIHLNPDTVQSLALINRSTLLSLVTRNFENTAQSY